jgi:two-component system response regulator HydG
VAHAGAAAERLVLVPHQESARAVVEELAAALDVAIAEWTPVGPERAPEGAAIVLLAAGREREAIDLLTDLPPTTAPLYLVADATDHRLAAVALQRGARDYFALPQDLDLLRRALERDVSGARAGGDGRARAPAATGFDAIVGRSEALRATLEQAERVAPHRDATVLVHGETGTGKELLARAIHYRSPRGAAPFVEINCAAIPHQLLESELFGHERGAFTGAVSAKAGLFEIADGGTIFLDEIGTLPLELQPKLLRALETRTIRRVGGQHTRHVDVRLLAATHVDLASAVARGEFREDLFYRLNVVALTLPPLRYRDGDIEILAAHFLRELAASYGLPVPPLTPEAVRALRAYHWPGNVRELRNAVERALVLSPRGTLSVPELVLEEPPPRTEGVLPFPADLATVTRAAAHAMLDLTGGNKSEAARRLGISRPRLQRLLYAVPPT